MNTGGLAQMSSNNYSSRNGLGNPLGGLASRRGGQNLKPLSFDGINNADDKENALPTPRTSRSHLLAGLRTAPKTATATSFGPMSPTGSAPTQQFARQNSGSFQRGAGQDNMYSNAPKTAYPQYGGGGMQTNSNNNNTNSYQSMMGQHYSVDQVLAPPELSMEEQGQEMDPSVYAQLVATNMYLAEQQQRLQAQLRNVQAAAQQFQQLNLSGHGNINPQVAQQQMAIYEQQQQQILRSYQQQLGAQSAVAQAQAQLQAQAQAQVQAQPQAQQFYYNPMTGQYYVDTSAAAQMTTPYAEQPMTPGGFQNLQQQHYQKYQQQQQHQQQQQQLPNRQTPRVQVSPPPEHAVVGGRQSPPKRRESPVEVTPLPPPSANAFRRGHKKASSLAPLNAALASASAAGDSAPLSAGIRSSAYPQTPGGYGPGQARAGEHPIRQPRGPPSLDELKVKPTSKHEGSKNFAARTRRSAVHNLMRAGLERRKGTGSSAGSMSPVSETPEESTTPITDNESESGRSGSGSLVGEEECLIGGKMPSSTWGVIGSGRKNSESEISGNESEGSSFAHVFKNGTSGSAKSAQEAAEGQTRGARLVLTSADKRKTSTAA